MLHSYQWFWIGGTFPFTWQDATFWGVLGAVMVAHARFESSSLARHPLAQPSRFRSRVVRMLDIGLTFSFLCVLWSLWTAESFAEWAAMWRGVGGHVGGARLAFASPSVVAWMLATAAVFTTLRYATVQYRAEPSAGFGRSAALTSLALAGLYGIGLPTTSLHLGPDMSSIVHALGNPDLNGVDTEKLQRGYYEELLNVARVDSALGQVQAMKPRDWIGIQDTSAVHWSRDLLEFELVPSAAIIFKGAPFHVNRWGMRDRNYSLEKPPGTFRIAILGDSHVMGAGVADGEPFESRLEDRLNRSYHERHYEILNFGVGGYTALQLMVTLERKVFAFDPDAVFYVAHQFELRRAAVQLARAVRRGGTPPYPFLADLLRHAGVSADTAKSIAEQRLVGSSTQLVSWIYQRIVDECRRKDVVPIWVFLPIREEKAPPPLTALAHAAGFTIIDLSGVYVGYPRKQLEVAPWDDHPNAFAHQLIAKRLYGELEGRPEVLGLAPRSGPGKSPNAQTLLPPSAPAEAR